MTLLVARLVTPYERGGALAAVVDRITTAVNTNAAERFNAAMKGSEFETFPPLTQADISVESLRHGPGAPDVPILDVELGFGDPFDEPGRLNLQPFAQVLTDAFIAVVGTAALEDVETCRAAGLTNLVVGTRLPHMAGVGITLASGMYMRSWGTPNRTGESLR